MRRNGRNKWLIEREIASLRLTDNTKVTLCIDDVGEKSADRESDIEISVSVASSIGVVVSEWLNDISVDVNVASE